jgi:hypothetical protein
VQQDNEQPKGLCVLIENCVEIRYLDISEGFHENKRRY